MNKKESIQFCDHIKKASSSLNELLILLENVGNISEFENARTYVAEIMSSMYFDLFCEVVKPRFPELAEYMENE